MRPPSEREAVRQVLERLAELLGLALSRAEIRERPVVSEEGVAAAADAFIDFGGLTFAIEWRGSGAVVQVSTAARQARRYASIVGEGAIPLVAVPFMGPVGREHCEEADVAWLDLSGNARIIAPGIRVRIDGQPNRFKRPGRPASVFAPKSARIARWLLMQVGGLVPSLLVDQETLAEGMEAHVGTLDLDVGLTVALLEEGRYRTLVERLRRAGFSQDRNEEGNPTRQRWKIDQSEKVTVDFLIQPTLPEDRGGRLRNIEPDFAAIIAPGLHLAFEDRRSVTLSGQTIMGEEAVRDVWVCGPGAYVVLKALAFDLRGENKDAYDLFYLVRNYGAGVEDVVECLRPLLEDAAASRAMAVLRRDFLSHNHLGPRRVAEFLVGQPDETIQADVVGFISALVESLPALQ